MTHTINVGKSFPDYVTFKRVLDVYCRSEGVVHPKDGKTVDWEKKKLLRLHFKKDVVYLKIRFECKHYGIHGI